MKPIKTFFTIFFIFLLPSPSWSATLDDLVVRNDLYYEKFTDIPFSGKVTGVQQGSIKNGKFDGAWVKYHKNGQLFFKANYKNGRAEGAWVYYRKNGQLWRKSNYKDGKAEGAWFSYSDNGQLWEKGNFKNFKKEGDWVGYHENGQLSYTGNYKNGKVEGVLVYYNEDGTVVKHWKETFKDGKKISD